MQVQSVCKSIRQLLTLWQFDVLLLIRKRQWLVWSRKKFGTLYGIDEDDFASNPARNVSSKPGSPARLMLPAVLDSAFRPAR